MTQEDLDRIESELAVTLPARYREFMLADHGDEFAGNSDCDVWDDPELLIIRNRALRAGESMGGSKPWPPELFFVGDPVSASGNAIVLTDELVPVHWVDHCDIEAPASGEVHPDFVEWASVLVEDLDK